MKDKEYIGKLINQNRKNMGITQQELAEKLNISDKAISNWETGKNLPDYDMIKRIEKALNIEILEKVEYKKNQKKIRCLCVVLGIIVVLLFFFMVYFITNFNKFNIYEITIDDSSKYSIKDGYLIVTKSEIILSMGNITCIEYPKNPDYTVTIYYKNDKTIKELVTKNDYDYITFNYDTKNDELLENINNLYIKINYLNYDNKEITDDIKLNVVKKISNNKLFYNKKSNVNKNTNNNILSLLKNNNYKETEKNIYLKEDEQSIFTLNINNNLFYYEGYINNYKVYAVTPYRNYNRYFNYVIYDQNNQIIEHNMLEEYNDSYQFKHKVEDIITKEVDKLLT